MVIISEHPVLNMRATNSSQSNYCIAMLILVTYTPDLLGRQPWQGCVRSDEELLGGTQRGVGFEEDLGLWERRA